MLKRLEFDILKLYVCDNSSRQMTQRELSSYFAVSLGTVNKTLTNLIGNGFLKKQSYGYEVTSYGKSVLSYYKVDNAIIMAAGMSSRFVPLSYEKPKGLLRVKGEILVEREIRQLQEAGIDDIILVVGYMKECFFYLEEKFGVKIVVNNDYYRYNNTSTLVCVLNELKNSYICSSDNYFVDNVFEQYVYEGYYSAVFTPDETAEYCMTYDKHGRIVSVTSGGSNSWYMLGHVYFDKSFSDKFKAILEIEYDLPSTKNGLWEDLYIKHITDLTLHIRKYDSLRVLEFDSLEELRLFDKDYIDNADSTILDNICHALKCLKKDITGIVAIKSGLTNTSFKFNVKGKDYVYRHPGRGTEVYINRKAEAEAMKYAAKLELDDTFICMDSDKGWKISKYIDNVRILDYHNELQVSKALEIIKKLHSAELHIDYDFDLWAEIVRLENAVKDGGKLDYIGVAELEDLMWRVHSKLEHDGQGKKCLCHNDCYAPNFLVDAKDNIHLIDWEYSGNGDPASDLGTFICCSDYDYTQAIKVIEQYLGETADYKLKQHYVGYVAVSSYYWYVWALYQDMRGNAVGEWLFIWYKNSKMYAHKFLSIE